GGWKMLAITSQKRLVDGRATEERCGYVRDVLVEKGPRVERATLEVPCRSSERGPEPDDPRLRFEELAAAEPVADDVVEPPAADAPVAEEPVVEPRPEAAANDAATVERREGGGEPAVEAREAPEPFLKGELTRFGGVQLLNQRTSFGVGFGAAYIDNVYYAVVRPDLNLHFGP